MLYPGCTEYPEYARVQNYIYPGYARVQNYIYPGYARVQNYIYPGYAKGSKLYISGVCKGFKIIYIRGMQGFKIIYIRGSECIPSATSRAMLPNCHPGGSTASKSFKFYIRSGVVRDKIRGCKGLNLGLSRY